MAEYLVTYAELQSVANAIREAAGADPLTNTGGDYLVDDTDLISLASAIRTAAGIETNLIWPTDFITQIESLSGMTIPSGTTTLAFPQGYINIIETRSAEVPYNITVNLYHVPEETADALYGESSIDAYANNFSSDIEAYIDDILSQEGNIYQTTITHTTTSSSETIDISTELNDLYSEYDFTDDNPGIQHWNNNMAIVDLDNKEIIINGINGDCVINIIFFKDEGVSTDDATINIQVIYIPSSQTCEQLVQTGLLSQGRASLCGQFHSDMSLNPTSSLLNFQDYLEDFRHQVGNEASKVLFECETALGSYNFSVILMSLIENINQQVRTTLPSTVTSNITLPIDNAIFLNVDSNQYNVIDSNTAIQYLGTPVKYLINIQENNLNAEDIVLSDAEDDQTIIILLIEDRQTAQYGLQ